MITYDYVKTRREDVQAIPPNTQNKARAFVKWMTRANVWVFKKTKGRLWNTFPGGFPICVVGMTGKKSGKMREIALIHLPKDDGVLLVASLGGMDKHPVWYYNLKAEPNVEIRDRTKVYTMRVREVVDPVEKKRLWDIAVKAYPPYQEYQEKTDRPIPVLVAEPAK